MYRRIGWTLVNLHRVLKIEAAGNVITYTLPVSNGGFFFFSGNVHSEKLYEVYANTQDCAKSFEELAKYLGEPKNMYKV